MSKDQKCMQQVTETEALDQSGLALHMRARRVLLYCSIIMVSCMSNTACNSAQDEKSRSEHSLRSPAREHGTQILRRGLPGEPRTLDPQLADDDFSFQVIRDLYEGLTAEDRTGRVIPGIASSWTVDDSGTIYEFNLRPAARWSNGQPIVAEEFVRGLRRAVDPRTASGSAANLRIIKGASDVITGRTSVQTLAVEAIGRSKVRIELEHPAPYVLEILAQPIAAPYRIDNPLAPEDSNVHSGPIVDGPYTLGHRIPGSTLELIKNPLYWNSGAVQIDRVRYQNEESETTELREYLADQIDLTFTLPAPDLARIQELRPQEVQIAPILWTLYLALNLSEPPLRESNDVRQALSMAVDREKIAKYVVPGVTPAYNFVAKGVTGYERPEYRWSTWTQEKRIGVARTLLSNAGYPEGRPLRLKLYFNTGEGIRRLMVAIAGGWKQDLGVECELISDEFRVFLDGRRNRKLWDVARLGWSADYNDPASFLENFSSGNAQNDPSYHSVEFDAFLQRARIEPQADKRLRLLNEAEQVLLNDYPIIPIYFYQARRLVKPYLGGAEINPMNRTYSKDLYWRVSTNP